MAFDQKTHFDGAYDLWKAAEVAMNDLAELRGVCERNDKPGAMSVLRRVINNLTTVQACIKIGGA